MEVPPPGDIATPDRIVSFHPKSWRFDGVESGAAFVGSSNISRAALYAGVEWNLRVDRERDPDAYQAVVDAFERWWSRARPLTADWVKDYAERAKRSSAALPPGEDDEESLAPPLPPHSIQLAALEALMTSRVKDGRRRALVVLATGLGKTYLATLDVVQWAKENGRAARVLVVAHREELLFQAATTFRRVLRGRPTRFSWCAGSAADVDGDIVFASVQKLSRPEHLARVGPRQFDYVIIDEVHHGTAPTYRSLLDHLDPAFLLGLTATPERADGADVAGLFDDHIAFRADLGVGIERGLLVPFAYHGLKDDVDYQSIPYHNDRFDAAELERAVDTDARLETMWRALQSYAGTRTLVFCASIRHAHHAADFIKQKGQRAAAVHSGPASAPREDALRALVAGELDALFTVDLFNEGVDLPDVDRVVMLRPTESPVVFLQQLGRGLRRAERKERLTVLDFVGNHRVFLNRVRTLLSLGTDAMDVRDFLAGSEAARLPGGGSIDIELEAKDLLLRLLPPRGASEVERAYRDLRGARGERPLAGELYRMGYRPSTLLRGYDGWFSFVDAEGDLADRERAVLRAASDWFRFLERTATSEASRMILLEALLEAGALQRGLSLHELARRCVDIVARSPELAPEATSVNDKAEAITSAQAASEERWKERILSECSAGRSRRWLECKDERVLARLSCPPGGEASLTEMTRELTDYKLAAQRERRRSDALGASFSAKVLWNKRDPILKLPSLESLPKRPKGDTDVRLMNGAVWRFRLMKEFCNVAHPLGSAKNALPDLLRGWFGPFAGHPSTAFSVRFSSSPDGLWVEPNDIEGLADAPRGALLTFPTLKVAAGAASDPVDLSPEPDIVYLPSKARGEGVFAVRATGDSMNGGKSPIRDGDWLVMRFARGASREELSGKVALLQVPDLDAGFAYVVKRVVRKGERWLLRSDNVARPSLEAGADTVAIAALVEVVRAEAIGPSPGALLRDDELAGAFGLDAPPTSGRWGGHLFFCIEAPGALAAPDRIRFEVNARRPGETAFVLTRAKDARSWRYAGVARYRNEDGLWACHGIDYASYRALSSGRGASRSLPEGALARAQAVVDELVRSRGIGAALKLGGKACRLAGRAAGGGVRIDGGAGGRRERTVTLTDIAWVLVARDDVQESGGLLDEQRVNRLRYLEGTPKVSTRWIDTGWALFLVRSLDENATGGSAEVPTKAHLP